MSPHQKLNSLKARTLEANCTEGEVAAAQAAIAKLLAKHPGLETEQTVGDFFEFAAKAKTYWNPNAAAEAVREGMRRAAEKAAKDAFKPKPKPDPREVAFTLAECAGKNATHVLRMAAREWRANGWSRADFVAFAVNRRGFNKATASTQWQRSQTQD